MPWPKTGATHYHAQLSLLDSGLAIKDLVVYWVLPTNTSKSRFTRGVYIYGLKKRKPERGGGVFVDIFLTET